MKKIAYIIPGYGGAPKHPKLAALFKKKGIEPIFVKIDWYYKKPADFHHYMKDFLAVYKRPRNTKVCVLGFSFGANIALFTAGRTKPDKLLLSSLSPYFKESLEALNPSWTKWWNKHFIKSDFDFNTYAEKVRSSTLVVVGDKEGKESLLCARYARKMIKDSKLSVIKGAGHDIGQKAYLDRLDKILRII